MVLTNGQVWRIYDDHITGYPPAERLVAEARLDQPELEQLLSALSKATMTSGGLGQFALRSRLSAILTRLLKDESSEAIKSLWAVIRKQPGMSDVARRDVAAYFRDLQAAVQPEAVVPTVPKPLGVVAAKPIVTPPEPIATPENTYSLEDLARDAHTLATGCKPQRVIFPNGNAADVTSWRDLTCKVLIWLATHEKLPPLPFRGGHSGHRYFLNTSPVHASGPMQEGYRKLKLQDTEVYVDLHRSAVDLSCKLRDFCEATPIPPSTIRVSLSPVSGQTTSQ